MPCTLLQREKYNMNIDNKTVWEGLPEGLVDSISKRLPLLSVVSMGDACATWREVLASETPPSQTRGLPWLMLCGQNDSKKTSCLSVLQNNVWEMEVPEACGKYFWGSFQDWLIVVERCQSNVIEICFLNPFLNAKIQLPRTFDIFSKIVLSASPTDRDCVTLLLTEYGSWIWCWTPGAKAWCRRSLRIDDVVFCNGSFYFVNPENDVLILNAKCVINAMKEENSGCGIPSQCHKVDMPNRSSWCGLRLRRYLVESCGEVLLVCRLFERFNGEFRETRTFEVFKLDVTGMVWVKMESLGDRILFIGKCDSKSFSSKELGLDR
ncbi:hypothetical protein ACHQM5_027548 [Ranunculus cassubicifolius]